MKNKNRALLMFLPVTVLTLLAIVLRTIACSRELDVATGYFKNPALYTASGIIIVLISAVLLVSLALKSEPQHLRPTFRGALTYVPSGLVAISLLFVIIDMLSYIADGLGAIFTSAVFTNPAYLTALLTALLAIAAIAYFALSVFISPSRNLLRAELGILASLSFAMLAAFLFFQPELQINHPAKVLDEMTFLALAIFFMQETRISLSRENWKHYFVFGAIASVLTAYSSIPALVYYAFSGNMISENLPRTLLAFSLLIFTVSRLIVATRLDEDKPSGFALAIDTPATEETPADGEEDASPQISIEDINENEGDGEE